MHKADAHHSAVHPPCALVPSYQWEDYLDLLTIRPFDRIITARIPARSIDLFAPEVVVWAYEGAPQPALRALLNLLPPTHPQACTVPKLGLRL
jgi:hypothetical protein